MKSIGLAKCFERVGEDSMRGWKHEIRGLSQQHKK